MNLVGRNNEMKNCKCGEVMDLKLSPVRYLNKVKIDNVPVYACHSCDQRLVCTEVKPAIKQLLAKLDKQPKQQSIDFCDVHELAYLLYAASDEALIEIPIEELVSERINQLLDLMIVAKETEDHNWQTEIKQKLSQITLLHVLIEADPEHNEI